MPEYMVTWEIYIEAEDPREAAEKALAIQRNPDSIAVVFGVLERGRLRMETQTIDLLEDLI